MYFRSEHDDALPCGCYCPRWFVVQTQWSKEDLVAKSLSEGDPLRRPKFTVYYPEHEVEPSRGKNANRNVVLDRSGRLGRRLPLFPRYVFVRFDPDVDWWRPICSTPGVERIFGAHPENPSPVPHGIVEELLDRPEISATFRPPKLDGMTLRVKDGPWGHFEGVCKWSTKDRVGVLMSLFGRAAQVISMRREQVELV